MFGHQIYEQIREILNEEPALKYDLYCIKRSIKIHSRTFNKKELDALYEEFKNFLDLLVNLAQLPKIRG